MKQERANRLGNAALGRSKCSHFLVFFVFALAGDGSVQFLPQERGLETAVVLIFESSRDTPMIVLHVCLV